jgi:sugar lactone lactonase YvrE
MKTNEKPTTLSYLRYAFLAVLLMAFSCSPDTVLESDNLESADAKSNKSILKTLVKGAALKGANGLDIGPDGNLYIGSVNGQDITVMNKNSGKIIRRISDGVDGADDVVFNPDGTALYWTDILTGFVRKSNPDGTGRVDQFVAPGVNPIRFSAPNPDDPESEPRLFTALDFLGDGLYELDPDLTAPPRLIIECPDGFGLGFFNSFDTRWENGRLWLYGPLFALNLVIAIDVDSFEDETVFPGDLSGLFTAIGSGQIRIVAGSFPPPSDLNNPAAAKFGPDGMLYILDQAGKVFKANPDGNDEKTLFATLQPGLDNMTFDDDGSLYMTNNDEGWVAEILDNGQARILSPGGIIRPQGLVAMEGSKNQDVLFEADLFSIRTFNGTNGRQVDRYKGFLIPEGPEGDPTTLILPMNLSPDGDRIVVSSWFSGGVQVWNPADGSVENIPYGVEGVQKIPIDAVRVNGDIMIADLLLGGVVRQGESTPVVPLFVASGLASDGETLWAADWITGNIFQVTFDGGTPDITTIATVSRPEGLALDQEGRLLVVETGTSSLLRIDLENGNDVTTLAEGFEFDMGDLGDAAPPTFFFDAVAVGPSGDIYVTGGDINVIYKITANKVR